MKHTYDIAHERDLAIFVQQHFAHLAERVRLVLFEQQEPVIARNEPLAAVVAVEVVVAHAVAMGNHPSLVIAVASKACGIPLLRSNVEHPMIAERPSGPLQAAQQGTGADFLNRVKEETAVAVTNAVTDAPQAESVTDARGNKIRIVRAGDVAGRVIQVLSDFEPLTEAMGGLDETETFALYGRLSTEIAKLITQGTH